MEKEIWVNDKQIADKFNFNYLQDEGDAEIVEIKKFEDMKKVSEAEKRGVERVFIRCSNWKVIPLENLIAYCRKIKIIAEVKDLEDAKLALQTLEKGVTGVLLANANEADAKALRNFLASEGRMELAEATVVEVRKVGMGSRSCIDTVDIMSGQEGLLVGCSSSGFFLFQAEVTENPHVNTRPFRVNCGAVSLYILLANGKTKYLEEIEAGDEVLVVNSKGEGRKCVVARNKIEWRPLLLLVAEIEGRTIKTMPQDAETIRIITPNGSKSVAELKKGDKVLVRLEEEKARHFGMKVEERIIEK